MTNRIYFRAAARYVALVVVLFAAQAAAGQTARLRIDYTVAVENPESSVYHITADVKNIRAPHLDLSLPVWTPGWYTIENYAKNILRFTVTDAKGDRLPFVMTRKQTWRVNTAGRDRVKVEFDYRADILALNQAKLTRDYGFFTGIQFFLMAEGHRASPSTVRFEIPEGWKLVTALKNSDDPKTFSAADYDTLVDSPTEIGNFDVTEFKVEGRPHYFVANPAGAFSKEKTDRFVDMLVKIAQAQGRIFGDLPYEKYVYFYFFARPESNAGGALEHANSFVAFAPAGGVATPEWLVGTAAHEFFHVWNVKRIRPAEMWPYDYSRENESPLLWVAEGFTNYYTNVSLLRAGLRSREQFLQGMAGAINGVENNEARHYTSPANSSTSTWLGYDTPVAFGISYYTQGQNLGALLDLSIINDTAAAASLDDVMRALYRDFYQKGKGFTTEDMVAVINRITKRDYTEFYRRYVWGVEVPPYDTILGYAGYKAEQAAAQSAELGFEYTVTREGNLQVTRVGRGSNARAAGLTAGDVILKVDGAEVSRASRPNPEPGKVMKLAIKRGVEEKLIDLKIDARGVKDYRIVETAGPSPAQLKVREKWLQAGK